jgi:CheY-like chemotaxis protein
MSKVQILLADDDEDDRDFFRQALCDANIAAELVTVNDGRQLTDYLSGISHPPPPDIIFLDINMPKKNGKVCLREIRNNDKYNNVPVVIFSTSSYSKDIDETFLDGANIYILKSAFFEDETAMLQKLFSDEWKLNLARRSKERFVFNTYL